MAVHAFQTPLADVLRDLFRQRHTLFDVELVVGADQRVFSTGLAFGGQPESAVLAACQAFDVQAFSWLALVHHRTGFRDARWGLGSVNGVDLPV